MYRIAVCDDEQADASYVEHFIKKWAQEHAVMVQVELFPSAELFCSGMRRTGRLTCCFSILRCTLRGLVRQTMQTACGSQMSHSIGTVRVSQMRQAIGTA